MADRRKLQGEIDRCLKKVQEGVDIFEDLWQKVQNATNANIKEKHEADLKKEIKKLQRLRDGIKTWLASSDIKDKKSLLDSKKVIEMQMERFKVIERETKTKAYSKEGLGAATKVDPKEKEKEEINNWLSQSIDGLNVQVDQYESEIEGIVSKRKKLDREKQDQVDQFRKYLEKHRFHIGKLETIMRLVDNDAIQISQISKIREEVDYYVQSSRDDDFEENDFIYDDLKLDEASAALGSRLAAMQHDQDDRSSDVSSSEAASLQNSAGSMSPSPSLVHSKENVDDEVVSRARLKSQSNENSVHSTSSNSKSMDNVSGGKVSSSRQRTSSLTTVWQDSPVSSSSMPLPSSVQNYAQVASSVNSHQNQSSTGSEKSLGPSNDLAQNTLRSLSSSASLALAQHQATHFPAVPPAPTNSSSSVLDGVSSTHQSFPSPTAAVTTVNGSTSRSLESISTVSVSQSQQPMSLASDVCERLSVDVNGSSVNSPSLSSNGPDASPMTVSIPSLMMVSVATPPIPTSVSNISATTLPRVPSIHNAVGISSSASISAVEQQQTTQAIMSSVQLAVAQQFQQQQQQQQMTSRIRFNPVLGVAPLGPKPLDRAHAFQLEMLEAVSRHLPHPADSQRIRVHFPHSPCMVPAYHYQLAPSIWEAPEFFSRLDIDTLFFIFYYMERIITRFDAVSPEMIELNLKSITGTKSQYMAAKMLKMKSWRFHTKHLMWFQRHDEPTVITEDFEQGSYWYFDYESWTKRKQDSFTFEYRYLEDHDLK